MDLYPTNYYNLFFEKGGYLSYVEFGSGGHDKRTGENLFSDSTLVSLRKREFSRIIHRNKINDNILNISLNNIEDIISEVGLFMELFF